MSAKSIVKTNDKKAITYRTGLQFANEAIKGFGPNGKVCGLTNGVFSLLSLIEAVLDITGPADVTISTWSAGLYDAGALNSLMSSGMVRDIRLILDVSFKKRQLGYAIYVEDVFKKENIRT
jgi:hypothetical protein